MVKKPGWKTQGGHRHDHAARCGPGADRRVQEVDRIVAHAHHQIEDRKGGQKNHGQKEQVHSHARFSFA